MRAASPAGTAGVDVCEMHRAVHAAGEARLADADGTKGTREARRRRRLTSASRCSSFPASARHTSAERDMRYAGGLRRGGGGGGRGGQLALGARAAGSVAGPAAPTTESSLHNASMERRAQGAGRLPATSWRMWQALVHQSPHRQASRHGICAVMTAAMVVRAEATDRGLREGLSG